MEAKVAVILWVLFTLFLRQSLYVLGLTKWVPGNFPSVLPRLLDYTCNQTPKANKFKLGSGNRIQVLKPSRETLYSELSYQPQSVFQRPDFED